MKLIKSYNICRKGIRKTPSIRNKIIMDNMENSFAYFLYMFFLKDCSSSEEYNIAAALLPLTTAFYRVSFLLKTTPILYCFTLHTLLK